MGGDGRMAINWEVNLRKNRRLYRRKLSCCPRSRNLDMFSVLQRAADVVGPSLSTIGCQQHGHRKCGLLQVDVRPHGGMLGSRPCVVADFEWLGRFLEREERWEAGIDTFVDSFPDGFFAQMGRASLFILFWKESFFSAQNILCINLCTYLGRKFSFAIVFIVSPFTLPARWTWTRIGESWPKKQI